MSELFERVHRFRQSNGWIFGYMLFSSLISLTASFVLSVDALELARNPGADLACNINSVISCGTVGATWQANLLGFPNAYLGLIAEPVVITIAVASLAKENEELFIPERKDPIVLPKSSAGLQLLQRLRDEAHRFAIGYFTTLHRKKTFTSVLDDIPGVGPKRKSALLRQFGSVQGIREASVDELVAATGMPREQAKRIKEHI